MQHFSSLISVIIPIYNVRNYISRCLDSVVNQTYYNLEIVVVNDATPDDSMAIVNEYVAKDSRFVIVNHEKNRGLMMTRRSGYSVAKGDYIMFVDSDDNLPLNAVETLYNKIIESGSDLVVGDISYKKNEGTDELWESSLRYGTDSEGLIQSLLKRECKHNLVAKLYKRELFSDYEYQSFEHMTNAEDYCLMIQLAANVSKVEAVNETVYYYLQNEGSSMNKKFSLTQIENIIVANKCALKVYSQYPKQRNLGLATITMSVWRLLLHGYKRQEIQSLLAKHGMEDFITLRFFLRNLSLHQQLYIAKLLCQNCINNYH